MNKIVKRILLGALVISVPVGGSIFYFANSNNSSEAGNDKNRSEVVPGKDEKDDGKGGKDDKSGHIPTDAKLENPHKDKIEMLKEAYQNDEVVGVVSIPGTSIDSVVVQHKDNEYYLTHNADNTEKVDGSVFLDYRVEINRGRKNLIYGHNGDENELNVPFSELENYYDKDFYNGHQYIKLEDSDGVGTYQIFSVYVETSKLDYMYTNFTDEAWAEHLKYLKSNSLYETNVNVESDDEILILQTCSHNEDYYKFKDRYLLVVAKRVRYE